MNTSFNVTQARFNMIEQQIRTWDVLDQDVLDLLGVVKREEFVPPAHRLLAFIDMEIPLKSAGGGGALMWAPKFEARVLQELALKPHDTALEIGTGSGYFAALLAHRCRSVTSVEIVPALKEFAQANLRRAGIGNVQLVEADGARGYGEAQYDAIVLTGSTPVLPDSMLAQLKPGGRLFAVTGDAPVMTARLYTRAADGSIGDARLFETVIAPLANAAQPARFRF
jgi:protein-L-isoaspartate(D-aspartate) O-methyltransferase